MLKVVALRPVLFGPYDFVLETGECLVVRGPSGSGKTLLLRALADLDPSHGRVTLDNLDRNAISGPQWRKKVRYVAAESGWWADQAATHFSDSARIADKLESVGLDAGALTRDIANLSTGERQRLAILRAIDDQPEILLLDEPTAALDPKSAKSVEKLLKVELERGCAIILVTHSPAQARRFAARTLKLNGYRQGQA